MPNILKKKSIVLSSNYRGMMLIKFCRNIASCRRHSIFLLISKEKQKELMKKDIKQFMHIMKAQWLHLLLVFILQKHIFQKLKRKKYSKPIL